MKLLVIILNIEMTKLLINYDNQHCIVLEINDKNYYGNYPLSYNIKKIILKL